MDDALSKKVELKKLLKVIEKGDTILIRSAVDLGKSGAEVGYRRSKGRREELAEIQR